MSLMNPPTARVWVATFVALVFTIGVLAGVVVERTWLHPRPGRAAKPRWPRLKLLEAQETRLRAMQEDARTTFIREQEGLHDKIAAVLSPEQVTAFREWVTKRTGRRGGGPGR